MSKNDNLQLADRVNAFTYYMGTLADIQKIGKIIDPSALKLRMDLRAARRFTLDNEFVEQAVYQAAKLPNVLYQRALLANLPFEHVWISFDGRYRHQLQSEMGTQVDDGTGPQGDFGFLLSRVEKDNPSKWGATAFTDDPDGSAFLFPASMFFAGLEGFGKIKGEMVYNDTTDMMRSKAWGYGPSIVDTRSHGYNLLSDMGGFLPDKYISAPLMKHARKIGRDDLFGQFSSRFISSCNESTGDLRFLVTVLAMINSVPVKYTHRPAYGSFTKRLKTLKYLDHSTVTIEAGRRKVVNVVTQALRNAERSRHRAHEVRGFYRVINKGTPRERRVWVREHQRGDASLGFVRQTWEVTA